MRIPREWHRVWGELERAELTRQATAELTRLGELDIGICMCVLMNVCEMRIFNQMWRCVVQTISIRVQKAPKYTNQFSIGS